MRSFLFLALAGAIPAAAAPLRLIVTGQTLMRFDIRAAAPDSAAAVRPLLSGDAVFTNLEAAVEGPGAGAPTRGTDLLHAVGPGVLDSMSWLGFNLLALGDNHSWDLGTGGVLSTLAAVESRGIAHAGTGRTLAEASAPGWLQTGHGRIALIAMATAKLGAEGAATATRPGVNELRVDERTGEINGEDRRRILAAIRAAAANADQVLVYEHNHAWASPMTETPSWLTGWARACIDAGGTVFIEHGEPLLHGLEIRRGHPIFYGLGNFAFQTRTLDKWNGPEIWQGAIVSMTFERGRLLSLRLAPLQLNATGEPGPRWLETRGWPRPVRGATGRAILERLGRLSAPLGTRLVIAADGSSAACVLPR